jgi:hypothetical protein
MCAPQSSSILPVAQGLAETLLALQATPRPTSRLMARAKASPARAGRPWGRTRRTAPTQPRGAIVRFVPFRRPLSGRGTDRSGSTAVTGRNAEFGFCDAADRRAAQGGFSSDETRQLEGPLIERRGRLTPELEMSHADQAVRKFRRRVQRPAIPRRISLDGSFCFSLDRTEI